MGYNKSNSKKVYLLIIFILSFIISTLIIFEKNVRPTVLAISEIKARSIATQAINNAVKAKIRTDIDYQDLIKINYDKDGKATTIKANTILMNEIASEVAIEVQKNISRISEDVNIKIPLFTAFDSQILAQYGPKLNVEILPKGSVKVDFATEFEESGINQTIHRVFLTITASVRIIVPLGTDTADITSTVPIAETVIVGEVPDSYVNIPDDELTNIIPGM